jgi:hypothetical protein
VVSQGIPASILSRYSSRTCRPHLGCSTTQRNEHLVSVLVDLVAASQTSPPPLQCSAAPAGWQDQQQTLQGMGCLLLEGRSQAAGSLGKDDRTGVVCDSEYRLHSALHTCVKCTMTTRGPSWLAFCFSVFTWWDVRTAQHPCM